jgi:hypothetical protein
MAGSLVLNEKRSMPRRELVFYLKVTDQHGGKEMGRMIDVHSQGLLVMALRPMELGREYLLNIEPPKSLQSRSVDRISLRAKCVWVKPSRVDPYSENGLVILDKSQDSERGINMLIDLFAMPDSGTRA